MRSFIFLVVSLVLCAGIVLLQISLSRHENKWFGFILPLISLLISLLLVTGMTMFFTFEKTTVESVSATGEAIRQTVNRAVDAPTASQIFQLFYIFALFNIPTAVLLAVCAACRGKRKRRRALEKMSAQDLE
jgi:Na+-transporting methylmalonyl-CoA/oxaloacetate decarboxylase gamma subunit